MEVVIITAMKKRGTEDIPLAEFMYLVFTRMPDESYRRRLRSLLYLCYVFRALINSPINFKRSKTGMTASVLKQDSNT